MVRKALGLLVSACALCLLASCDLFTTTPFPGFIDKTDKSIDVGSLVDSISGGKAGVSYDLSVVTATGADPRVLLLVEPPSSGSGGTFNYTGQLIFMDKDLSVLGRASTATSVDYFSKPYTYTHDGNLLAGYTRLAPDGGQPVPATPTLSATGLEGYAFRTGTVMPNATTVLFATPSGAYTSFQLSWLKYTDTVYGVTQGSLKIIPDASLPSPSDPNYSNLGYQLAGLTYNSSTQEITFVLSQPSVGRIVAARCDLATATTAGSVLLSTPQAWPVTSWPISIDADRPAVFAGTQGLFLVRREGWMNSYSWPQSGALSVQGSTQIAGDRSLSRRYAFLMPENPTDPAYMYRFDPSSRILTRYRRWW
jgi:hypothetical protein